MSKGHFLGKLRHILQEQMKQPCYAVAALVLNPVLINVVMGLDTSFDCWSEPNTNMNKQTLIDDHIEILPK